MSLIFHEVEFKNFMSFGNIPTKIKIENGTTLIIGENLDEGGSSGAGKTTIVSAISFALYDKIPSGVSKDKLINQTNDKKTTQMEVAFSFSVNDKKYKIIRRRGAGGGVQLFEGDKDITPASIQSFNEMVESLIGFTYNMFSQVILFSGNSRPFLDYSVGEQRDLIEELFKITTLSQKAVACKQLVSQTEKDIAVQQALIEQQKKQNEVYERHLQEAKNRAKSWDVQREKDLKELKANIETLSPFNFDREEDRLAEIETLQEAVSPLISELKTLQTAITAKSKEKFPLETQLALLRSKLPRSKKELETLNSELKHLADAKCPYCLQKYEDAKSKIKELELKVESLIVDIKKDEAELERLINEESSFNENKSAAITELKAKLSDQEVETQELNTAINYHKEALTFKTLKDLTTAKHQLANMQSSLIKLAGEANPHIAAIDSLEKEGPAKIDHDSLNKLLKLKEHQQFLVKLLIDKNSFIRKNIISKTIPFLNKRIGYYTEKLLLPHIALFQPDMSCQISQYGRELDHGNLSNGEKKRLNLALCLAFRDVLTYLHSKVNVLFTDEIDGGSLDSNCVDALISLLKRKAWDDDLGIYIISHRSEFEGRCDRNLIVRKERGFSTIITQPDE